MKKNIVVVDDFANTLLVIESTLKKLDCNILKANNGKEALALFDGRKIDLLITDLNMPIMNGIDLVKTIKETLEYRTIPIVMLTTEMKPEMKQKAIDLKITTWMQKPFQTEEFIKVMKKCLQIS